MANIDNESQGLPESTGKTETGDAGLTGEVVEVVGADGTTPTFTDAGEKSRAPVLADLASISRPTLVPLGTGSVSGSHLGAAHPKRFSAVNINKKFLEKNSSASSSSPVSASSPAPKSNVTTPRPSVQPSPSHSRLVTTKLTATPQPSTTTGPGWTRPSSAAPTPSPSATPSVNTPAPVPVPAAPQLPHAGKVIQPQPRAATQTALPALSKDGSGSGSKPAWGNVKAAANAAAKLQNDFPTAAEVAQGVTSARKAKLADSKEAAVVAAADKQARSEEADTFRGIHLDPNAHHWDEMEEDDDNFLDGVIEFGDGRQYKLVESTEDPPREPPRSDHAESRASPSKADAVPVTKAERFADDDFDRSWPRSKTSPGIPQRDFPPHTHHPVPPSPGSSQHAPSPQDSSSSRVLFNERSNRLEPYSNAHPSHRPVPPGPHPPGRGAHSEFSSPYGDSRSPRDGPASVQLLQKNHGSGESAFRGRDRLGSSESFERPGGPLPPLHIPFTSPDFNRPRDQHPPFGHANVSPGLNRDREFGNDHRGRRSSNNMGPPPLFRAGSRDTGRQLPPHLSQMPPPQRRVSSRESRPRPPSSLHGESPSSVTAPVHPAAHSPVTSHASFGGTSVSEAPLSTPAVDMDEVRKAAMHSAAERAKQRRQQEEQEREQQKERARKKAAELEAKMKALQPPKEESKSKPAEENQVIDIIEAAVKSSGKPSDAEHSTPTPSSPIKPRLARTPSLKPYPRQATDGPRPPLAARRTSHSSAAGSSALETPAGQADSWRAKAHALPHPASHHGHARTAAPSAPPPKPPVLHTVAALATQADGEELETIDFSELGKLVGDEEVPVALPADDVPAAPPPPHSRPPRPVASDFFDDDPAPVAKSDLGTWRRKRSVDLAHETSATSNTAGDIPTPVILARVETKASDDTGRTHRKVSPTPSSQDNEHRTLHPLRSTSTARDPGISTLDDAMARIKGALDGMQIHEHLSKDASSSVVASQSASPPKAKVLQGPAPSKMEPPAPVESKSVTPPTPSRAYDHDAHHREVFDVTRVEPPRSPKPAWNAFPVRLPKQSWSLEPVSRRQLTMFRGFPGPPRFDILSWNPPIETMGRDFALNNVLHPLPKAYHGKLKCRVQLPGRRHLNGTPKVHLPAGLPPTKGSGVGAFGRPAGANEQSTWRKSTSVVPSAADATPIKSGLDTVSRSPPPDIPADVGATASTTDAAGSRSKPQPKMPEGSAVAFYRDSRVDTAEPEAKTAAKFIVHSELEENSHPEDTRTASQPEITVSAPLTSAPSKVVPEPESKPAHTHASSRAFKIDSPEFIPSSVQSKADIKSPGDSTDRGPLTPPSQQVNAAWTKSPLSFSVKDSPARAPDPEHLKAVWSQASDKARLPAVNSLEGIADDLTGLPFTLQDVKSEDGGTPPPPPSTAPPSRMSLHDVTRAFQQVPSSSTSSATQRTMPMSPPSTNMPTVAPHPSHYAYAAPPVPPPVPRSPYPGYPSPMIGSPSMYPHGMAPSPVPGRMSLNGHAPVFGQPLWMPIPAPPGQNPNGMMRPVSSPYPGQMVSYPPPNGAPAMYAQPSPGHPPQPNGVPQGRGRGGMPMMSPVMQQHHPGPAYGSPVLMHASAQPQPIGHSYMSPTGRGQMRHDHPPAQHSSFNGHQHPQPRIPGYNPVW
ncbi:hypothetical protein PLICRDRAFT_171368 [Plicaturopsis crispa FD-325 SS-3]|nr:hypothetical protein PLICRDRAFT_171368 [Plicaturopsis crispa FD-325 SS-3]